jgi:hypothetical protein
MQFDLPLVALRFVQPTEKPTPIRLLENLHRGFAAPQIGKLRMTRNLRKLPSSPRRVIANPLTYR